MSVDTGESVYNYAKILAPVVTPPKQPLHRSRYPGDAPPSFSTFGRATVSQVPVANVAGDYVEQPRVHPYRQPGALLGPKDKHYSDTTAFLRKQSKPELPQPRKFEYPGERKSSVPKRTEKPVMGLASRKDFVRENKTALIGAKPAEPVERNVSFLTKPEYGRIPDYLHKVKAEVEQEKELVRQAIAARSGRHEPRLRQLPEEERLKLLDSLKAKWDAVNKQYQTMTHTTTLDTMGKIRRKEQWESQLTQLERAIEKLSKKYVLVPEDHDEYAFDF